jgi:hypothetical protein
MTIKFGCINSAFIDFLVFSDAVKSGTWTHHEIVSAMKKAAKVT